IWPRVVRCGLIQDRSRGRNRLAEPTVLERDGELRVRLTHPAGRSIIHLHSHRTKEIQELDRDNDLARGARLAHIEVTERLPKALRNFLGERQSGRVLVVLLLWDEQPPRRCLREAADGCAEDAEPAVRGRALTTVGPILPRLRRNSEA